MQGIDQLFENNRTWSARQVQQDPEYFKRLTMQQKPQYLWIGCADSRVPANEIVGLQPGELFVHRNVANVVVHSDLNSLSVLQFAVEFLKVKHVIVCGHYGCSGVGSVVHGSGAGISQYWLRHVEDVAVKHACCLETIEDPVFRADRLCELNVIEQVTNVCRTNIVQEAWNRGQELTVHGVIYSISDGILKNLDVAVCGNQTSLKSFQL